MAARILGLRLQALQNALRHSPVRAGLALLVVLVVGVGSIVVAITGAGVAPRHLAAVFTIATALLLVGTAVAGLVTQLDSSLDPRSYSLVGERVSRVSVGILVASLLSRAGTAALLVAIGAGIALAHAGAGALAALAPVLLVVAGGLVRLVAGAVGMEVRERFGPRAALAAAIAIVLATLGWALAAAPWSGDPVIAAGLAIAATPPGSPIGAGLAASMGHGPTWSLVVAIVGIVVLAVAWHGLALARSRHSRAVSATVHAGRIGVFALLPATQWGAVAGRSLISYARDRRYPMSLAAVIVLPVLLAVPPLLAGISPVFALLPPVAIVALLLGWIAHDDVAYDSTAYWLHIASDVHGWADRLGRLVPVALIGVPFLLLAATASAALYDDWRVWPALVGAAMALLGVGFGVSSITSAAFPYSVAKPGENAFVSPASAGASSWITQALSLVAILVISSPVLWFAVQSVIDRSAAWLLALAGVALGVAVAAAGVVAGGAVVDRRGPELLELAVRE